MPVIAQPQPAPASAAVQRPKEFPTTDFLVVGNQVYSLGPTDLPLQQVLDKIKVYYEDEYQARLQEVKDEQFALFQREWTSQQNHITRAKNTRTVSIPPELQNKLVMTWQGEICEVRQIQYCPVELKSAAADLRDRTGDHYTAENGETKQRAKPGFKKVFDFVKKLPGDARVIIKVAQNLVNVPATFAYNARRNILYTPFTRYYHTLSDGNKVCTGNHQASDFWNNASFAAEVNKINYLSLANSSGVNGYGANMLMKDEFVVDITREDTVWRA